MDPITIGIAIAGAKKLLETAGDLKDIAGSLDALFHASEAKPKKVKHKKPKTRMQQILRMKSGDVDNLGIEIDNKFGKGTFEAIKAERVKRIEAKKIQNKKNKEKAAEQKEIDDAYWDNIFAIIKNTMILIGVSIICVIIGWLMTTYGCQEKVC